MKKTAKNYEWLQYFKYTVRLAARARLDGNMSRACSLDETIEAYYRECEEKGYTEDTLTEIEIDIRNREAIQHRKKA